MAMTAAEYHRTYGESAYRQAYADGYYAARVRGSHPNDWPGLELDNGKRWIRADLRAEYAAGYADGMARNQSEQAAA